MKPIIAPIVLISLQIFLGFSNATDKEQAFKPVISWELQKSGCEASFRGVSAVDARTAWVSGSRGTFGRTSDGGRNWTTGIVPGAAALDFRDIEAFDEQRALLLSAGRPAEIFSTSDGGKTWRKCYHDNREGIFFDAFAFSDSKHGLSVGDPIDGRFVIIVTHDGGRTWQALPENQTPIAVPGEGGFAASGTCLCVGDDSTVRFCSGGAAARVFSAKYPEYNDWTVAETPLGRDLTSAGCFSILFLDHLHGVVVGGDYRNEGGDTFNAAITIDGGIHWTAVEKNRPGGFRECVALAAGRIPPLLIALGPSGADFSLDQGQSWFRLEGFPQGFHSLSFAPNGKTGWAAGKNGSILKIMIH